MVQCFAQGNRFDDETKIACRSNLAFQTACVVDTPNEIYINPAKRGATNISSLKGIRVNLRKLSNSLG